jgi:hypothetical protein
VELWEAPIWESARKHGIGDADIRHALRWRLREAPDPDDQTVMLYLGPDRAANFIEVGVLDYGDDIAVIHAMRARQHRFFDER